MRYANPHGIMTILMGTLFLSAVLFAQTGVMPAGPSTQIDKKARQAVEDFSEFIAGQTRFSLECGYTYTLAFSDLKTTSRQVHRLSASRPDKVALLPIKGLKPNKVVFNGQKVLTYIAEMNQYTLLSGPETIENLFDETYDGGMILMQTIPLINALFTESPYEVIMEGVTSAVYKDKLDYKGTSCHQIELVQESEDGSQKITWQMLIEAGPAPLLRRIVVNMNQNDVALTHQWSFDRWQTTPDFTDKTFAPTAPAYGREVLSFGEQPDHALIGEKAADFSLKDMDGNTFELSEGLKNNIAVIDFWAIFCPPCRKALPVLSEFHQEYKDKGVLIYGINTQDTKKEVAAFVKEHEVSLPMLLAASKPQIPRDYGVRGIPQTVIINKNGIIQSVHVGFDPRSSPGQLKNELDALLTGKDVAGIYKPQADTSGTVDLACDALKLTPNPVRQGRPFGITCTIANSGDRPVKADTCRLALVINEKRVFLGPVSQDIPAGGEIIYSVNPDILSLTLTDSGTYNYFMMIDPDNRFPENNEENNIVRGSFNAAE